LNNVPINRVQQFHLAGHLNLGNIIIDSHGDSVIEPVWTLYKAAVQRFGPVSTLLERDDNVPSLADLMAELDMARQVADSSRLAA